MLCILTPTVHQTKMALCSSLPALGRPLDRMGQTALPSTPPSSLDLYVSPLAITVFVQMHVQCQCQCIVSSTNLEMAVEEEATTCDEGESGHGPWLDR